MTATVGAEKAALRKQYLAVRNGLSSDKRRKDSQRLCEIISALPCFARASGLLLFYPIGSEPALLPLAKTASERQIPVAFPLCLPERQLTFLQCDGEEGLEPGPYGLRQPQKDLPPLVPDANTLCLLPGLAFDGRGFRLGYGQGYYDRFLPSFPGFTLAPLFSECFSATALPHDAHDIPTRMLVLPDGQLIRPETD